MWAKVWRWCDIKLWGSEEGLFERIFGWISTSGDLGTKRTAESEGKAYMCKGGGRGKWTTNVKSWRGFYLIVKRLGCGSSFRNSCCLCDSSPCLTNPALERTTCPWRPWNLGKRSVHKLRREVNIYFWERKRTQEHEVGWVAKEKGILKNMCLY